MFSGAKINLIDKGKSYYLKGGGGRFNFNVKYKPILSVCESR